MTEPVSVSIRSPYVLKSIEALKFKKRKRFSIVVDSISIFSLNIFVDWRAICKNLHAFSDARFWSANRFRKVCSKKLTQQDFLAGWICVYLVTSCLTWWEDSDKFNERMNELSGRRGNDSGVHDTVETVAEYFFPWVIASLNIKTITPT